MSRQEDELHVRGHRVSVWRYHAQDLRRKGIPITVANIAKNSDESDFASEESLGHSDYSGGTDVGKRIYSRGKVKFIANVLTADPKTMVVVDGEPDDNCNSCFKRIQRHCDTYFPQDEHHAMHLMLFAQRRGYHTSQELIPDKHDPTKYRFAAKIPAGAIQEFVFNK